MDIVQLGARLLKEHLGSDAKLDGIVQALTKLLGGSNGQVDLSGLVAQLSANGGLQSVVQSWLGDGSNAAISPAQIIELFGNGKLGGLASQLGVSTDAAAGGLAAVLPQMIDKASSGGTLLESVGGLGGVLGMAKKLF